MKTFGNLYGQITSFDNLLLAARNARKGKRFQANVAQFDFQLERNLFQLLQELQSKTYRPGVYHSFIISEPKERMISAAPYRDRVVHHALCNVTAPIFERTFIYDSYANRRGKGTHAAILRFQHYARRYPYVLKCDIRKFFPSIDHALLKQELRWKITCPDTLWLIDAIIDNSNPQEEHLVYFPGDDLFTPHQRRHGLPIGNLTSQWWGNIYLNRFDHFYRNRNNPINQNNNIGFRVARPLPAFCQSCAANCRHECAKVSARFLSRPRGQTHRGPGAAGTEREGGSRPICWITDFLPCFTRFPLQAHSFHSGYQHRFPACPAPVALCLFLRQP